MKKFLITGGAGNVGSSLALKLSEDPQNFIVIADSLLTGSIEKIPIKENVIFFNVNVNIVNDLSIVFKKYNFDYVFHYAALVGVQRTLNNPMKVLNDIDGIKNILELSSLSKVKRVFYSSSSEVYGEPFEIPQNEKTTPLNSRLPYAIVKNVGEAFFRSYKQEYNLDYTIFRFFNTYGPNQSEDFVIPKFLNLALENKPITIFGEGSQTRTFCYIEDNIDTCVKVLNSEKYINDELNVGNDIEVSILELAKIIIKITNSTSEIMYLPALEEGDMTRRCPDIRKMKNVLQRDLITLEEGIKKLINHYEKRN
ncbi:NAD-dependent epimerase/dehydratase family protein [uncultured Polaribacter sp.]|uniref:NAD-dependent epimerase/dehydratase family protein n=1 Tax=uncultured Polaribacter sp. TaxID=174711 RepID=UPI00260A96C3|nr:NAD-dependent epimerase/dehydratase family protein [uncultured Polaribacter sp.]